MNIRNIFAATAAFMGFAAYEASAQNLQVYYDCGEGRQYVSTSFEMFKADKWGDTFFIIDHYFTNSDNRELGLSSAVNGSYFEIERGLNFWQDSKLKDLSVHLEYDGSTFGTAIASIGVKYFLHSADFKNTFSAYLMYDQHLGNAVKADIPVKFTAVWGMNELLGIKALVFKGFLDIWGCNSVFADHSTSKVSVLAEPQLWYNLACIGVENLNVGTEIELSYNFLGHKGLMCAPCFGVKWDF